MFAIRKVGPWCWWCWAISLCLVASVANAFAPFRPTKASSSFQLRMDGTEQALRKEIAERNVNKVDEDKYIIADGEDLQKLDAAGRLDAKEEMTAVELAQKEDFGYLTSKLERLTQPRPYPLFIAEKAAELAETTFSGIAKALNSYSSSSSLGRKVGYKERVVVLGTGWGAISFLSLIDTDLYDVTVISPRNFFVFTPMLAGASVGTVEFRSITENVREINPNARFLEATATNIDPEAGVVTCQSVICVGNSCDIGDFTVEFDRLIVTVGAQTNTFGIPGVRENCNFLKQVEDARRIRTALVNCFERANLPNLTDEERKATLTFAIIGAGPTGIEFASELRDFVEQDGPKYYPQLLKYVRIKVIEASSTVLAPFDKSLQEEAIRIMNEMPRIKDPDVMALLPERFKLTELLLESSVREVTDKTIILNDGSVIPYGMTLWAAGNGPLPITLQLIDGLGEAQKKEQSYGRGRIVVDSWLRAFGSNGRVLAFGDCSCMIGNALPATAQVAAQQGEYLASLMNRKFDLSPPVREGVFLPPVRDPTETQASLSDAIASLATNSIEYAKPFQFLNLGILAYTGGSTALAQVTPVPNGASIKSTGEIGNFLWRSVYLSKQVSWRNRILVVNDWVKRTLFGRDITRL